MAEDNAQLLDELARFSLGTKHFSPPHKCLVYFYANI